MAIKWNLVKSQAILDRVGSASKFSIGRSPSVHGRCVEISENALTFSLVRISGFESA